MKSNWWYLQFVTEVGLVVAVPLVVGAFIGKWIDSQWDKAPIATLVGIVIAIIISVFNLVRLIQRMLAK